MSAEKVFDPEQVERWESDDVHGDYTCSDGRFVKYDDYDALLALYREATIAASQLHRALMKKMDS